MSETTSFGITVQQESDYVFRIQFDETAMPDLMTDEPAPLGGGSGPNPSRLLAAAVANCMSASLLFALRKYKNQPGPITTKAVATMGRNEAGRMRVDHIDTHIHLAERAEDHQQIERILAQFEGFCVVTESVRHGVNVSIKVSDSEGKLLHG
jgi:organic hydroperoxide reductase OsmC/OhrA